MRTTIELPDPLFRTAKSLASEKGISLKAFFTEALKKAVTAPDVERKRMDRPPIGKTKGKRIQARTNTQLHAILELEELSKSR